MDEITKRQVTIMKKHRKEMGFTQGDIAEEAGITLQQYQNFEYGRRKIANCSTILALRICAALELDPYEPDAKIVYADIIRLPHWQSPTRTPMSAYERAAQFSSFNALAGYEDMVGEEAREVGSFQELTESEIEVLNQKISLIADALENYYHPVLKFTYFIADIAKVGGSYVTMTERVRKIDAIGRKIQLFKTVGASKSYMELEVDKIRDISGELVDDVE